LINELRRAGLSREAIDAAWPNWWSDEVAASESGRAELRFVLARKLGLAPKSLLGERIEFVWKDRARFKNLTNQDSVQQDILSSFGVAVGRLLLRGAHIGAGFSNLAAMTLRDAILQHSQYVDLKQLLSACWGLGVPVIQLRVFPLAAKSAHAMVIELNGRCAIILGRDSNYPAVTAFTLAHEIGHIAHRHLDGALALVDAEDPAKANEQDSQELEADAFGLTLLTGSANPVISTNVDEFNSPTLAAASLRAAAEYRIEPGTLALCLAYRKKNWPVAMSALRFIYPDAKPVWSEINGIAKSMIDWESVGAEGSEFLQNLMGIEDV
tara:strand:- start:9630 stop:10604 length:975 start_codon:yes stop_codon:yes gene_type:complete